MSSILPHRTVARMDTLMAEIQGEYHTQVVQREADLQRQVDEMHAMRQMLDTLEQKHKTEVAELHAKIREQEEVIRRYAGQPSPPAPVSSTQPTSQPHMPSPPDVEKHWGYMSRESFEAHSQQTGVDWHVIYNPHIPKRVEIDQMHAIEHDEIVCCVRFSSNGQYIATASNKTVKIFETQTGGLVSSLEEQHNDPESLIRCISFSPDGRFMATSSEDMMIRVWDIAKRQIDKILSQHTKQVDSVEWAADGRELVSASRDRTVRLWDVERGQCILTLLPEGDVVSVSMSNDMEYIAASCNNSIIYIWNRRTGDLLNMLQGPDSHSESVYCLSFFHGCSTFISGSLDSTAKVWRQTPFQGGDTRYFKKHHWASQTLRGHSDYVVAVGACAGGKWALTGSKDRTMRLWDAHTGEQQFVLYAHKNTVLAVAPGPGPYFATGSGDKMVRVWSYKEI